MTVNALTDIAVAKDATVGDVLLMAVAADPRLLVSVLAPGEPLDEVALDLTFHYRVDGRAARAFLREHGYDMKFPKP